MFFKFLISLSFLHFCSSQYLFGRSCGGGCPTPMCQPKLPCAPPPMPMCPPPPPCPPQFCPPPPICPPPPPPMPCPPPPPPPRPSCPCMSRPSFYPTYYQPMFQMTPALPAAGGCGGGSSMSVVPRVPAQNDCCCGCSSPCKYKSFRRAAFAAKTVDPSCNSSELGDIIRENISNDASESKRNIQKAAQDALGYDVNVICGSGEFSYIAHTNTFCQTSKDDITCYAFKPL